MAQDVAILDIGSEKITVLIGERGVNNTINIIGTGECGYAGFTDGVWHQPEQLSMAIGMAISGAETNSRTKIRHLYIGVPGEFCSCVCKKVDLSLNKKRKITDVDVESLHEQGNTFKLHSEVTLINSQPIYYTIDDGRRLMQPVGLTSSRLGGFISYIFAETSFIEFMDKIMAEVGIESAEYVCSMLAETLFLFSDIERDRWVVLIDVGYTTTNVVVARGDGILCMNSFSRGGGHISGDLAMAFDIPFSMAESLKRKVVLSLNASDEDVYNVSTSRDSTEAFPAKDVNMIATDRIKNIAKTIETCLSNCKYEFPDYIPYHITGGGLCYMKGARDLMSKFLGKPMQIVAPSLPQFTRPHLSSSLGLMDMVLRQAVPAKKKGFFSRLFGGNK